MKILLVADYEMRELWNYWESAGKKRTEGVELILSAGDIRPHYLEFLVTMLNVPCLYVRGNHDGYYDVEPPGGCIDIDGRVCEIRIPDPGRLSLHTGGDTGGDAAGLSEGTGAGVRTIRIAGLGGSMRYHDGPDMYTEKEMRRRIRSLRRSMRLGKVIQTDGRLSVSRDLALQYRAASKMASGKRRTGISPAATDSVRPKAHTNLQINFQNNLPDTDTGRPVDILLTHAPSYGHGDLDDLPHRGFDCFNDLIERIRPQYHCYGHVHSEYDPLLKRESEHPAGTHLINVCGMYILEI